MTFLVLNSETPMSKWFVKGDVDGFFGLWMDNLINLLLIVSFLKGLLGFSDSLIFGRVLPAAALSLLGGNLFYTWQARRLAEREGRDDVTAMPYGLNTVTLFAFIFFVMLPVKLKTGSAEAAWKAGLAACFVSGVIETIGSLVGGWIRRIAPRAALLSALGGIALTFISMDFAFRIWENPLLSMVPLGIILVHYFGGFRFPFGVPGGLVAVAVGVVLSAVIRGFPGGIPAPVGLALPSLALDPLFDALFGPLAWDYLAVSIPMGLMTLVGSLMCLESAAAAGDSYDTGSSLAVNGAGSLLAACLGSCFPTTIYIGHPAWKKVGARSGYSALNGTVMTILCFTGSIAALSRIIPSEALFALMLWIGVMMLTQAFQAVPKSHGPAVAIGLIPAISAWGLLMVESSLRGAGATLWKVGQDAFAKVGFHLVGMVTLERGFLFTSIILTAIVAKLVDKEPKQAGGWALAGAVLSWFGIIHAWRITPGGVVSFFGWGAAPGIAVGYLLMAVLFFLFGLKPLDKVTS